MKTEKRDTSDDDARAREWNVLCRRWLAEKGPAMVEQARLLSNGDLGVIVLTIDGPTLLAGRWVSAPRFLTELNEPGLKPDAYDAWAAQLSELKPATQVAVLLTEPQIPGRFPARTFAVLGAAAPVVH